MFNFINNINNKLLNTNKVKMYSQTNLLKRGDPPPPEIEAKTVCLFSQPYLDTYNQCYKNIVILNLKPQGPLANLVRYVKFPPLSEFKQTGTCSVSKRYGYALISLETCNAGCGKYGSHLMEVDEVPSLISYLSSNNYTIDTNITKMFNQSDICFDTNTGNKLICFITYNNNS